MKEKYLQQIVQKQVAAKEKNQMAEQAKQRFLILQAEAPISGRNLKTTKKQLASQTSEEVIAGSPAADSNHIKLFAI